MKRSARSQDFRDKTYEQFSRIGKAVSSPKRLELLDILSQGENTVENLAKMINQSVANTSQHLQVLRAVHLVEARKNGLYVNYSLANDKVANFFLALRRLAESQLAEIRYNTTEFLESLGLEDKVEMEELIKRVEGGEATLVDLRTEQEFNQGHIPGAVSVPAAELEKHLARLNGKGEVVAYCRGPYCVLAMQAVELMRKHGVKAHRLPAGIPEWKEQGNQIESTKTNSEKK